MNVPTPSIRLDSGLAIGYGAPLATFGDSVELQSGTHFLLARNGRGKSTLLKTIAGSLKKISGNLSAEGYMQYLPEDMRFDNEVTPKIIFKTLLPKASQAAAFELAGRIELDVNKEYGRLSTGNRRKTALIMAEYSVKADRGNILLLDEPFSGLDAFARETFEGMWRDSAEKVLRLVSCHPDYDSMAMPSVLLIDDNKITHHAHEGQTWSGLKALLN